MDPETLALFEDGLARFNRERYAPAQLVEAANADEGATHWQEMADLGWLELGVSETGLPQIEPLLSIFRAAGEGLWREPIACAFGEAALVAARAENPELRRALCTGLATGAAPLAFAAREPGQAWDAAPVATRARISTAGTQLTGCKVAVVDHPLCSGYLVSAVDDRSGQAAYFCVDRDARGLELTAFGTVEGRRIADLKLDHTAATFVAPAGPELPTHRWGSLLAAAECVGVMRGTLQDTVTYLRQRKQFGRPLIDFQVLQHRLADMLMLMRETDALVREMGADFDAGLDVDDRAAWIVRAQSSRAALHVTREAVQMHGGMGVTQECRVSHYYRRVLTLESLHGPGSWALDRLT